MFSLKCDRKEITFLLFFFGSTVNLKGKDINLREKNE